MERILRKSLKRIIPEIEFVFMKIFLPFIHASHCKLFSRIILKARNENFKNPIDTDDQIDLLSKTHNLLE